MELQNAEENKCLLAAQRQTYADAKRVDFANACICLLVPLGVAVVQTNFSLSAEALVLIWTATVVAGIFMPKWSGRLVGEAAAMSSALTLQCLESSSRTKIEMTPWWLRERGVTTSTMAIATGGLMAGNSVSIGDMKAGDAIARCQWQNTEWTKRQLRRSICMEACVSLLIAVILFALAGDNVFKLSFLSF